MDKDLVRCTPEDAFKSTTSIQLAMISYNTNSLVKWDDEKRSIDGDPEAKALLKREYRGKYVHPQTCINSAVSYALSQ